jgi:hypothetical protein
MAGENFDPTIIRTFPPVNYKGGSDVPHFSENLQDKIREAEPWFYQTFPTLDPVKFTQTASWKSNE